LFTSESCFFCACPDFQLLYKLEIAEIAKGINIAIPSFTLLSPEDRYLLRNTGAMAVIIKSVIAVNLTNLFIVVYFVRKRMNKGIDLGV